MPIDSFVLQVRGATTTLGRATVLNRLDLPDLASGELVALLGPNGSGKSTLLKSLAGLIPASFQQLQLGERDLHRHNAVERALWLRYLPQTIPGDVHLSAFEAVLSALHARPEMRSARHIEQRAAKALQDLGIDGLALQYLDELSGGQRQLIALAQALCLQPHVLLLDEPLASLDLSHQHHVMQLLARLAQERALLIIVVLHDLNTALRYADKALLLRNGNLIASGPTQDVITTDALARTFAVQARIESCSRGLPHVIVDGLTTRENAACTLGDKA